jgi:hypothetical protein
MKNPMKAVCCPITLAFLLSGLAVFDTSAPFPDRVVGDEKSPTSGAVITVDAGKPAGTISRFLTGACIEDVNHEIYGGLYSQMIFGESFQEPAISRIAGFTSYGGSWDLTGEELRAGGGAGPKLVSEHPPFTEGDVGVELFFADRQAGNAGLIVKVARPGAGANNFDGYEVSLDPAAGIARLGRHRHNWKHIRDTPCDVPVGEWISLVVRMKQESLEIVVNGKRVMSHDDREHPLPAGTFGLRQWQRAASYRRLWLETGGHKESIPFQSNDDGAGGVSGMWTAFKSGTAAGSYSLDTDRPFIGRQAQRISFLSGAGEVGIQNQGLNRWGLALTGGKPYEGYVWARADDHPAELIVGLESRDGGRSYAETKLPVAGKDWQRLNFTLMPNETDRAARFVLKLSKAGSVVVGHAFLQPGAWGRFRDLPVRRDVAEALISQGITVLRYGGSMVNDDEYRWKKMIGPRDERPPYHGTWYPYSTNGWGILDFLNFCEAAGFLAIPDFNMGETPQDMADFVSYVNGTAESAWGRKRVTDGHPAPYRLKFIQLGNEERVDENYFQSFRQIAEAVWAADPEMILVVGDFVYGQPIADPEHIQGAASGITTLAAHKKILQLAREHAREVWFDIHVGTEHPGALGEVAVVPTYVDALAKLAGEARHKVVIFELNAGNHAQRRALANAIAVGELQKLGDRLPIVCSANCLQPDGQNDNDWDQGLLFLNPEKVWLQPPGFVTQMLSHSFQPVNLSAKVENSGDKLKATAQESDNRKVLVLRVVQTGAEPLSARITLNGFVPEKSVAHVEELAGLPDAVNTAADPERIKPRSFDWRHALTTGGATYTFPPYSFTVIRFE